MRGHSENVIFVKQEYTYTSKLGESHVIKINNEVVYRELNGEVIKDIRDRIVDETKTYDLNEIKEDKKTMNFARKIYKNKRIRKLIMVFGTLVLTYIVYSFIPFGTAFAAVVDESITTSSEMEQVRTFIDFIINIIRVIGAVICSLIVANAGLKILTDENTDGVREAKKTANKILWALFLIFVGTSIASLIARKLLMGL